MLHDDNDVRIFHRRVEEMLVDNIYRMLKLSIIFIHQIGECHTVTVAITRILVDLYSILGQWRVDAALKSLKQCSSLGDVGMRQARANRERLTHAWQSMLTLSEISTDHEAAPLIQAELHRIRRICKSNCAFVLPLLLYNFRINSSLISFSPTFSSFYLLRIWYYVASSAHSDKHQHSTELILCKIQTYFRTPLLLRITDF